MPQGYPPLRPVAGSGLLAVWWQAAHIQESTALSSGLVNLLKLLAECGETTLCLLENFCSFTALHMNNTDFNGCL